MPKSLPTQDDILPLERAYWDAMCRKDSAAASRLAADPSVVTGKQGVMMVSRQKMKAMTDEGNWTLDSYRFDDVTFLAPAPDVAVLAYTATQTVTTGGKSETLRAAHSSTWTRGTEGWTCCAHSEAFLG